MWAEVLNIWCISFFYFNDVPADPLGMSLPTSSSSVSLSAENQLVHVSVRQKNKDETAILN